MAPVVHGLEDKYGEYMNFVYLDVDKQAVNNILEDMNIYANYIPTFLFLDSNGNVVGHTMIGSQSDRALEEAIQELLINAGIFAQDRN